MSQNLASGLSGAAPIWNGIMKDLLANQQDIQFTQPGSVVAKTYSDCNLSEYFIEGTEPKSACIKLKGKNDSTNRR
jgi:membrane carboxypeptidase/penicillin-binding protein